MNNFERVCRDRNKCENKFWKKTIALGDIAS